MPLRCSISVRCIFNYPDATMRDPGEGYRWLMRAALVDNPAAQELLSGVLEFLGLQPLLVSGPQVFLPA